MRLARILLPLAVVASATAGCSSSSSDAGPAPTPTAPPSGTHAGLLITPVVARFGQGVPLGPQISADQKQVLSKHDCSGKPETLPDGSLVECAADKTVFLLKSGALDAGVASATPAKVGTGKLWYVKVQLDDASSRQLGEMTQDLSGSEVAVSFHGVVIAAPIVESDMTDGKISVLGDYDKAAATELASQLTAS